MEADRTEEVESDGEEYVLPPVELPKRAVTTFKSVKESLVVVPDLFKEEVVSIDEGSI